VRIDDVHLSVRIESASLSASIGDDIAIVHYGVLRRLDRDIRIDDLQGFASFALVFLRAAREAFEGK